MQHRITINLGSNDAGADLRKRITEAAKAEGRSESGFIRRVIIAAINKQRK